VRGRAARSRPAIESHDLAGGHRADAAALDAVTGAWLVERASTAGCLAGTGHSPDDDAPLTQVRVDVKTVRGARNADGSLWGAKSLPSL
jgi:hypothetical protein